MKKQIFSTKYSLHKCVNNIGFNITFDIEVEVLNEEKLEIEIDDKFVSSFLKNSKEFLRFGIFYFYDKYQRGLKIKIKNIHFMPVDSSHIVLTYGVIDALSELLNFKIDGFEINKNGFIQFAK
ncbi:hypothetical protein [Aureivirga sp. CE67]|uniref:hypothetical protein n=1 Tax=Aureivirga sp. CE67 TaxID=1788983 RepID=UPI0018C91E1F|nr:hypothetical protein [Aureivirga sp. CE67]